MNKYIKPELNVESFELVDVITTSSDMGASGRKLKSIVNGNTGTDYGSQDMSVFD